MRSCLRCQWTSTTLTSISTAGLVAAHLSIQHGEQGGRHLALAILTVHREADQRLDEVERLRGGVNILQQLHDIGDVRAAEVLLHDALQLRWCQIVQRVRRERTGTGALDTTRLPQDRTCCLKASTSALNWSCLVSYTTARSSSES
jgi:hypothetical protein